MTGPVGPSPYDVVRGWHKPFAAAGVRVRRQLGRLCRIAEPHLRRAARRGQAARPDAAGIRRLRRLDRDQRAHRRRSPRLAQLPLHARRRRQASRNAGRSGTTSARAPTARARIACASARTIPSAACGSSTRRSTQIYVFSNDGKQAAEDARREERARQATARTSRKPQDVAFLPDGRVLIADGLDNHRVMILDRDAELPRRVRRHRQGPRPVQRRARRGGRPRGPHLRARSLRRPHQRVQDDGRSGEGRVRRRVGRASSCRSTSSSTTTASGSPTCRPLRFIKLDFKGNQLYTWLVPPDLPDGYLEVHTFTVDSNGNLYGGDNQYGRTQKFVPKPGADKALLIRPPWVAR